MLCSLRHAVSPTCTQLSHQKARGESVIRINLNIIIILCLYLSSAFSGLKNLSRWCSECGIALSRSIGLRRTQIRAENVKQTPVDNNTDSLFNQSDNGIPCSTITTTTQKPSLSNCVLNTAALLYAWEHPFEVENLFITRPLNLISDIVSDNAARTVNRFNQRRVPFTWCDAVIR